MFAKRRKGQGSKRSGELRKEKDIYRESVFFDGVRGKRNIRVLRRGKKGVLNYNRKRGALSTEKKRSRQLADKKGELGEKKRRAKRAGEGVFS